MCESLQGFSAPVRQWFEQAFEAPTAIQRRGWPLLQDEQSVLLLAPTGSGKTLAAFLSSIDKLSRLPEGSAAGTRILYISPLKALVADVQRNLRAPLIGIRNQASRLGVSTHPIRVFVRTGDTPQKERRRQLKDPAEIVVTTPESLYLMLTSKAAQTLATVHTIIIDEIHVMAGSKRGVHLALSLERLCEITDVIPQRVALSATQRPLERIAAFLGGERPVQIVDASEKPTLDLSIRVMVPDMENPVAVASPGGALGQRQEVGNADGLDELFELEKPKRSYGVWPTIHPELVRLILAHKSTIVFSNSRLLAERLASAINELAGEELVQTHHGSLSHARRTVVEDNLKSGALRGLVATSSLELGIDMGHVDLVILVQSPSSVASGLQRVGRAGHGVGQRSSGQIFAKHRGDLIVAAVLAQRMADGWVEETFVPTNCLDVLSQQIVAAVAMKDYRVDELYALFTRAYPYKTLPRGSFESVLDMLSGRYPSDEFSDLQPRINWDRVSDTLTARRGAARLAVLNGGTIADRGLFRVYLVGGGPRIGELDEEMVYEMRTGDRIILGASTWKVEEITRDRVLVSPAPGQPGRLPFWRGDRPSRPLELGERIGAFTRQLLCAEHQLRWLQERTVLDEYAAKNLLAYVSEQALCSEVPTDRTIVVEHFFDELGDQRVCILTPFGSSIHAPWALSLRDRFNNSQTVWTDDGLSIRFSDNQTLPDLERFFPDADEISDLVVQSLGSSPLFGSLFRENAGRALLLTRRSIKGRRPLWAQRLKAQQLLAAARQFASFPIVLETYRQCLAEVFDLQSLKGILNKVQRREIAVREVHSERASPFARSLVFANIATQMYSDDTPLAERRAAALSLDRGMLRELLGHEKLSEILVACAVSEALQRLMCVAADRKAKHKDALADLLRRQGDLSLTEVSARCEEGFESWLSELELENRVVPLRIAGEVRYVDIQDCGRYNEALGVVLPAGLAAAFLEPGPRPLRSLMSRYLRVTGPCEPATIADRWALPVEVVTVILDELVANGELFFGSVVPSQEGQQYVHTQVLRLLKRSSLAHLRGQVAPVDESAFCRFLLKHQRVGAGARLGEVIHQLQGAPIVASELESEVLRCRVRHFRASDLDSAGAMGEVMWIGRGPLGATNGRLALYRPEQVAQLAELPQVEAGFMDDEADERQRLRRAIYDLLSDRGAMFVTLICNKLKKPSKEVLPVLWDLAWAGLITNDTFLPLRGLKSKKPAVGGRWGLVADWFVEPALATERAAALALGALRRYGVVSAGVPAAEGWKGGFSSLYTVLREMEDLGKVRRGWFVDGLNGVQFALPGVVDQLRSTPEHSGLVVLCATDPAQPYGALLPWPKSSEKPRRAAGTFVVMQDGAPLWFTHSKGKRWGTFEGVSTKNVSAAARLWLSQTSTSSRRSVDLIDSTPADRHPWADALCEGGFVKGYNRLDVAHR